MDWQDLLDPGNLGIFAPYILINMLLAAGFGWIGGWLSHRWASKREQQSWERDFNAKRLNESEQELEKIRSQINNTVRYLPEALAYGQQARIEALLTDLACEISLELDVVDGVWNADERLKLLLMSFFSALVDLDTDPTPLARRLVSSLHAAYQVSIMVDQEDVFRLRGLVEDAWEVRQRIRRLQQDLDIATLSTAR